MSINDKTNPKGRERLNFSTTRSPQTFQNSQNLLAHSKTRPNRKSE